MPNTPDSRSDPGTLQNHALATDGHIQNPDKSMEHTQQIGTVPTADEMKKETYQLAADIVNP